MTMAQCETCGNDYDKAFQVVVAGTAHTFDSFECAIQALAPTCAHCGCRIIGHGMEADGVFYCCAHCASQHGVNELEDRVKEPAAQRSEE
jgi:Rieske Fe-S protein